MSKLTIKQKKFADEYIISGNGYKSAISAGYSKNYANKNITKLLENVGIKSYIQKRIKKLEDEKIATQEEVLQRLSSFARREEKDDVIILVDEAKYDDKGKFIGVMKVPKIFEITTSSKDTIKALELLGKRYKIFSEKTDIEQEQLEKLDKILEGITNEAK